MRALACIILITAFLGLTGCNLFSKSPQSKPSALAQHNPPAQAQSNGRNASEKTPGTTVSNSGLLAGRVIESYDRAPPPAFIQVVNAQDAKEGKGNPIEVVPDSMGYFTIQGLQPGQHYQLIARTREGERKLAGTTFAMPPNPRVLIYMSEDFATSNVPAAPGEPSIPGKKSSKGSRSSVDQSKGSSEQASRPNSDTPIRRAAELGTPVKIQDPVAQNPPRAVVRPEELAADQNRNSRQEQPLLSVPPQNRQMTPAEYRQPTASTSARVPSCVLRGRQLENFALYDLNGNTWEYRNHQGKLVLLDFWGTWCMPCLQALPHLKTLHQQYAGHGLEIVGIAYEHEASPRTQVERVENIRNRAALPYRLLMGSEEQNCPVRSEFRIQGFPTLVLIDENGRIVWQKTGPTEMDLRDLDSRIRAGLGLR